MRKLIPIILITIVVGAALVTYPGNWKSPKIKEIIFQEEEEPISINFILTNEMSNHKETQTLDKQINKFLTRWEIKGAGLAIIKKGKLIYSKGYGWADKEEGKKMDAGNIFRLASLSKLVTAAAIMKMQEESLLKLSDKVFGEGGILDLPEFSKIKDKRIRNITVDQLLRHQAGFTMHKGDPLFTIREIIIWEKLDTVPDMDRIIQYTLSERLGYTPGTSSRYSNVGYLILSKIIEVKSGMSYEEYCQKKVLHPAGCYDMHLAKNLYEDKYPNEVRYYETHDAKPILAFDNSGTKLYRRYGGNNIEGLFGAGGWVASPSEFARFIASIDGNDDIPDVISAESVRTMITKKKGQMPIGWVRAGTSSDWLRTGTLAGSSAIAKVQRNGYIWVFVTNTSSWKGSKFPRYIESMFRKASSNIIWPERDLFSTPR